MLSPNSSVSLTGQPTVVKLIRAVDALIHNESTDTTKSRVSISHRNVNYVI